MSSFHNKLTGKKVVVIGGSSGYSPSLFLPDFRIGFGVAETLVEQGSQVIIISSSPDKLHNAVERLKQQNESQVEGRVASVKDTEKFVEVLPGIGEIDHLVYSAVDLLVRGPPEEINLVTAKEGFEIKFWGAVTSVTGTISFETVLIVAVAKYNLIRPGGSIVLTSGTAGLSPHSNASLGGALNGAVIALTRGLAVDLAKKEVRVNTVIPGLVQTELWEKVIPDKAKRDATIEGAKSNLLVPFVGTPSDIAEAYIYFLRADYATGTTAVIDGGALLS